VSSESSSSKIAGDCATSESTTMLLAMLFRISRR